MDGGTHGMTGRAVIIRGDAAHLPLPDASVDLIVTSPPYFGLRSYTDGGEHYDGQIGSEATPREYLEALWACTAEWLRVLKPEGSLFVNLGDKYASPVPTCNSGRKASGIPAMNGGQWDTSALIPKIDTTVFVPEKSLMGMPWRYALGCVDDLGLILRAEIVWAKPNGLPESVTDRVRRSHEQVFHFTRQPRYYSAVDEVREAHIVDPKDAARRQGSNPLSGQKTIRPVGPNSGQYNPLGKLPGSVWEIASAPLTVPERLGVDHFAAYPPELVRRIVLGWSPAAVCTACGQGRRPVVQACRTIDGQPVEGLGGWKRGRGETAGIGNYRFGTDRRITGYTCGCRSQCVYCGREDYQPGWGCHACGCYSPDETPAAATPGTVLDPFGGTGTTALVASVYGRIGISVDRSADYCRLAEWRVTDPGERARALDVPKPPPVTIGQTVLF